MPRPRLFPALLALAGLACPLATAIGFAIHDGRHDHGESWPAHQHTEAVDLALHGHNHEPGTPRHEHPLVFAKPAPLPVRTSFAVTSASQGQFDTDLSCSLPGWRGLSAVPSESPSPPRRTLSVLRI